MKIFKKYVFTVPQIFKKVGGLMLILPFYAVIGQQSNAPSGLLCELLRQPGEAIITDSIPEFSWILPVDFAVQSARHILVASTEELLKEGKADFWDSGKVKDNASVNVAYKGKPLQENTSYWWKVKIWNEANKPGGFSLPQQFNSGDFDQSRDEWPGEIQYIELPEVGWVSENRQTAAFTDLPPEVFKLVREKQYFADFGRAAFGTLQFTAEAPSAGAKVTVYLGERKNPDNTVNKEPGKSNIGFSKVDMVLREGTETYTVEYPSHALRYPHSQKLAPFYPEVQPFRYVEIVLEDGDVAVTSVRQKALFYPFDDTASHFKSSSDNLNAVWDLCKYTLKATPFLGVYADGNRERMPYEADAYIQQLGHYCVDREFSIARYTTNFLLYHASWPTEWQMHTLFMAWADYMHTGDKEFIEQHYDDLKKKALDELAREDGLISTRLGKVTPEFLADLHFNGRNFRDIVDWPAGTPPGKKQANNAGPAPEGERDGYVFTDVNTVVNAFHYRSLVLMTRIAAILDKDEDKNFYAARAEVVRSSIMDKLFDTERGIFTDGEDTDHASLHANMFPLAFGVVPDDHVASVVDFIKSRGMACSVYGAQYLLEALYRAGEDEYALQLMTSEEKRSWMNMIRVGSTMTTEAWDEYYKPNLTWNHAWGSAPGNIIPRKLMGIEPLEPGFKRFSIHPQPGSLSNIEIVRPTIMGSVRCTLEARPDLWSMEIDVPGNTEAELRLPARFEYVTIDGVRGVPAKEESEGLLRFRVFELMPGRHTVQAK
jgi:hypothetical protein